MDVIGGLSAAKLALDIAKDIKEIDRSVDEAGFKLKLADLTVALADTKFALSDAKLLLSDKDEEIADLKKALVAKNAPDQCPKCKSGLMVVVKTAPHGVGLASKNGVQIWTKRCDDGQCGHEDKIIHDPNGIMKNQ